LSADVDIPDKVLEKRIHLAEVRAKRKSKAFLLRGFLGIKSRSRARAAETRGEGVPPGSGSAAGTDRVVKVSFGRVECLVCSNCRDNEVVGPIPLSLDWEVLSVMVASVDQYELSGSGA
jgi:hypothetical protein